MASLESAEIDFVGEVVRRLLAELRPAILEAKRFLTVKELAQRWQVTPETVSDMARTHKVPAVRVGKGRGEWRFDPALVSAFEAGGGPARRSRRSLSV